MRCPQAEVQAYFQINYSTTRAIIDSCLDQSAYVKKADHIEI